MGGKLILLLCRRRLRLGWATEFFQICITPADAHGAWWGNAIPDWCGRLADTAAGRRKYAEYLAWLSAEAQEQKRLGFDRMSKGWVLGTQEFKKDLVKEHRTAAASLERGERDLAETRIAQLEERLEELLAAVGKRRADLGREPKSAPWKVAVAAAMKATTTATNHWLGQVLDMGSPYTVSRLASACRSAPGASAPFLRAIAKGKA